MLFAFAFLAVNNLDVLKQQNPLKSNYRTEQYVFLARLYGFFWPSYRDFPNSFTMKAHASPHRPYDNDS